MLNFGPLLFSGKERPVSCVPKPVILLLVIGLSLQLVLHAGLARPEITRKPLPAPTHQSILSASSLGDPVAFSRLLMLWLQGFDHQPGVSIPFIQLDYGDLIAWLDRILFLDPGSSYPLLSAVRIYSEVPDPAKQRLILDYVYNKFQENPALRWQWLAHAVYVAKHRLQDKELALRYARELRIRTTAQTAPDWARQMELFVLEDMGELESAQVLLGGLIDSGEITDQREIDFLMSRLGVQRQ
jgi:hypothetical protein